MTIFSHYQNRYEATLQEEYSLHEYLDLCKEDASVYASAAERMLLAIGEPELDQLLLVICILKNHRGATRLEGGAIHRFDRLTQ